VSNLGLSLAFVKQNKEKRLRNSEKIFDVGVGIPDNIDYIERSGFGR
jgi:hypothetical protein